jgi:catechol 2,3-dioxygenase
MDLSIDPGTVIGHVHLQVSDLKRSVRFYTEAFGFEIMRLWDDSAAFLSAGGYHHHLGLNTWNSKGAGPASRRAPGLYHFAILYPTRRALAVAFKRLIDHGVEIDGASDHGVSEAIYLHDPDGNGIEIYRDRPRDQWPKDAQDGLAMTNAPVDFAGLLAELER